MTARNSHGREGDQPVVLMAAYTNYLRDPRVRREAEALTSAGYRVVMLASEQSGQPKRQVVDGVEIISLRSLGHQKTSMVLYIADYLLFFGLLAVHLLRHPRTYALIHINNMPDFLVFATVLQRMLGTPVIHDVHDLMPELFEEKFARGQARWIVKLLKLQERWAGRFASAVLTVEDRLVDILSQRGIPREKIHVLMNLPDETVFAERDPPRKQQGDRFVIVYHGTLARRLGLDLALRAVAELRKSIPDLELRIIGAGEERQSLVELTSELRLGDVVRFSDGYVPVTQIPAMIKDADIGVIPLRISSGTDIMLPTKLLEYVSMGIPCVVPRTGTVGRYFDDDMVEFFEAENVDALASAIRRLYDDPMRRESLAREATARFGRAHRWGTHKQVYLDLVLSLLKTRH